MGVPNKSKKVDDSKQVVLPSFTSAEPNKTFKAPQPKVKNKTRGKADPPILSQLPQQGVLKGDLSKMDVAAFAP
ncbi:hypothetical protein NHQ30_003262 [Ciborinia camelliae]|nr:hypothetical protein NHQ30_003262 [Ciborinia camelliae]